MLSLWTYRPLASRLPAHKGCCKSESTTCLTWAVPFALARHSRLPFANPFQLTLPKRTVFAGELQVCTGVTPKALRTNNAWEFTSAAFANSLAKLGVAFYPSLPYFPQENGKVVCLNQTLGDMARAMVTQSRMPASFIHNQIPNSRCLKSFPHQELFGQAPSITTLYPHGADAIVHIPAVHQQGKLAPRAIE
ncbi:hypothetical protein O181_066759 [Austropuccinia psidii MF-1]|uniref:Integrase catalytic domain-containing protein n=1 Tax=Austropuccinia psidii MF-1 TaxID=1389203 RepID=A0A9Q3EU28_9BASI|nr:hypothetical protein [Austropuccinia psidii MF-1]